MHRVHELLSGQSHRHVVTDLFSGSHRKVRMAERGLAQCRPQVAGVLPFTIKVEWPEQGDGSRTGTSKCSQAHAESRLGGGIGADGLKRSADWNGMVSGGTPAIFESRPTGNNVWQTQFGCLLAEAQTLKNIEFKGILPIRGLGGNPACREVKQRIARCEQRVWNVLEA